MRTLPDLWKPVENGPIPLGVLISGRGSNLQAVIDDTFSLERAPEALARLEQRQVFGKLVVTP